MGKGFIFPHLKMAFYCVIKRAYRHLDDTPVLLYALFVSVNDKFRLLPYRY